MISPSIVNPLNVHQPAVEPSSSDLLDQVRAWFDRFIVTSSEQDLDLLAVWTVHTHLTMETKTTPRLLITSARPGSGKTTVLEHFENLCHNTYRLGTGTTAALMGRVLKDGPATLLTDEAEKMKGGLRDEFFATLNAGYRVGATRLVLVPKDGGDWEPESMPTFGPMAVAGNSLVLPDDSRERCATVRLMRDMKGEAEPSDWDEIHGEAHSLQGCIVVWADSVRATVQGYRTQDIDLPAASPRQHEVWRPLMRIAMAAGGDWPGRVYALADRHRQEAEDDAEDGTEYERAHVTVVKDLARAWPADGRPFVSSEALVIGLGQVNPQEWKHGGPNQQPLTAVRLARMLKNWSVRPVKPHGEDRSRGYYLTDLGQAFEQVEVLGPLPMPVPAASVM